MKEKLVAALFCLLFAAAFGAVGIFATWAIGATVRDGVRAQDWVRVKADVDAYDGTSASYRYTFRGREYTGTRLGSFAFGGTDNIDDWHEDMAERLAAATAAGKPITVFVNPQNPAEAMIDREIRWKLLVFMLPFSLAFGGVGVGALWALTRVFGAGKPSRKSAAKRGAVASDTRGNLATLWVFAFFWNVISFPIALLLVPRIVRDGEWVGLLVMLFPLVGLFLLWSALSATFAGLRRGTARLVQQTDAPRVGAPLEGSIVFPRGVRSGDSFFVRLSCLSTDSGAAGPQPDTRWWKEIELRAIEGEEGVRVPFRFDIPARLPASSDTNDVPTVSHRWRLEARSAAHSHAIPQGFDLTVRPGVFDAPGPAFIDDAVPAGAGSRFDDITQLLAGAGHSSRLSGRQKASLAALSAEQRAQLVKVLGYAPLAKKIVIGIVSIAIASRVIPLVAALFTDS